MTRQQLARLRRAPHEDLLIELVRHGDGRGNVELTVWLAEPKWRVSLRLSELRAVAGALVRAAEIVDAGEVPR